MLEIMICNNVVVDVMLSQLLNLRTRTKRNGTLRPV